MAIHELLILPVTWFCKWKRYWLLVCNDVICVPSIGDIVRLFAVVVCEKLHVPDPVEFEFIATEIIALGMWY